MNEYRVRILDVVFDDIDDIAIVDKIIPSKMIIS